MLLVICNKIKFEIQFIKLLTAIDAINNNK